MFFTNFHEIRFSKRNKRYKIAFNERKKSKTTTNAADEMFTLIDWKQQHNKTASGSKVPFSLEIWNASVFVHFVNFASITIHKWVMTVNMKVKHLLSCYLNIYLFGDDINILFKLRRTQGSMIHTLYVLVHNVTFWSYGRKLVLKLTLLFLFIKTKRKIKRATTQIHRFEILFCLLNSIFCSTWKNSMFRIIFANKKYQERHLSITKMPQTTIKRSKWMTIHVTSATHKETDRERHREMSAPL